MGDQLEHRNNHLFKNSHTSKKVTVDVLYSNFRLWSREDRESHQSVLTLCQEILFQET
jgi:hypothetical protein